MPLLYFTIVSFIIILTEARPYKREICDQNCPFACILNTDAIRNTDKSGSCSQDPVINFKESCFQPELFKCDDHVQCPESYKCCETSFVPFKVCKMIRAEKSENSITFEMEKSKIIYSTGGQTILSAFVWNFNYNLTINKPNQDFIGNIEAIFQNSNTGKFDESLKNRADSDRLLIPIPIPAGEIQKNFTESTNIGNEFITDPILTSIIPEIYDYSGSGNYASDDEDYHLVKDLTKFDYIY